MHMKMLFFKKAALNTTFRKMVNSGVGHGVTWSSGYTGIPVITMIHNHRTLRVIKILFLGTK